MQPSSTSHDPALIQSLLDQLALARESLRQEREALAQEKAQIQAKKSEAESHHQNAVTTRKNVRKVAARYLKMNRARIVSERKELVRDRKQIEIDRRTLNEETQRLKEERERFTEEAKGYSEQVQDAWTRIEEQQAHLNEERQRAETEQSRLFQMLAAREADVETREATLRTERHEFEERSNATRAELAGLEQRIMHARLALGDLEQQRAKQTLESQSAAYFAATTDVVPIAQMKGVTTEQITADLQRRELEVQRERRAIQAARVEMNRLVDELADQRALLKEQCVNAMSAQKHWHEDEAVTLGELEEIARELASREDMIQAREYVVESLDETRKRRESQLWRFQTKLEEWQAMIARREAAFAESRNQMEAALAERRLAIADREASLDRFCMTWDERSSGLRDQLMQEIVAWVDERKACDEAMKECNRLRLDQAKAMEEIAKQAMGIEAARAEMTKADPKMERRVRVLGDRWSSKFGHFLKEMNRREIQLKEELNRIERRFLDLRKTVVEATKRQEQVEFAERNLHRLQLQAAGQDEPPVILSFAEYREQIDNDLASARNEVVRIAGELLDTDESNGVLKLKPAA